MTKRISLLFRGEAPPDAPSVMWVSDATTAEQVAERIPGAVGYVDLDRKVAEVTPGTLSEDEVQAVIIDLTMPGP